MTNNEAIRITFSINAFCHASCGLTLKVDPFSLPLTLAILSRGCWTSTTVPQLPLATVSSPTTSLQLSSNQFCFEATPLDYQLVGWRGTCCVQVAVTAGEGGRPSFSDIHSPLLYRLQLQDEAHCTISCCHGN